jgi:hypothetical protein
MRTEKKYGGETLVFRTLVHLDAINSATQLCQGCEGTLDNGWGCFDTVAFNMHFHFCYGCTLTYVDEETRTKLLRTFYSKL